MLSRRAPRVCTHVHARVLHRRRGIKEREGYRDTEKKKKKRKRRRRRRRKREKKGGEGNDTTKDV